MNEEDRSEFQRKIRSINFGQARHRKAKRTIDETATVHARTTEHWNERVDVELKIKPLHFKGPQGESA